MSSEGTIQKWFAPDGVGSIEVLEVFGSDTTVVNAARVSFNKTVETMGPADEKLIAYLVKHKHESPFFHPQIRLRIKMPIFVAREWYRHTVGFARNEVSRRYVDTVPELWYPQEDGLRARDPKLKQGSRDVAVEGSATILAEIHAHCEASLALYDSLLRRQVAPEVARTVLPQSMFTEFIETASLAAYARLWRLRTDPGAQAEIRAYADALGALLTPHFPVSASVLMT